MAVGYGNGVVQSFECFSTLIDRNGGPAATFLELEEYQKTWRTTKFTAQRPLDEKLWRSLTQTKSSLKLHVRAGVIPKLRRQLWLSALQVRDEDVVLYSKALGQPEQGHIHPEIVLPPGVPGFSQRPEFTIAFNRVLEHITEKTYYISHCPVLPIIAHLLLHFLEEWECFVGLNNLLKRQASLNKTEVENTASILTIIKLMNSHLRGVDLTSLKPIGMGENLFLMKVLTHWYRWPFINQPFWIAVRIMDLYLVEGPKIFYRLALSAIKLYHSSTMLDADRTGDLSPSELIPHFLSTLTLEQRSDWIHQALNLPRFAWDSLFKTWLQNCSIAEEIVDKQELHMTEQMSVQTNGEEKKPTCNKIKVDPTSEILSPDDCQTIGNWLPDWAQGDYLNCIFQASKHGYNLRTLYRKCELTELLILVIRSRDHSVFGAVVISDLKDRHNNTFFGSGETFLFTLKPNSQCYYWTAESDLILRANDEELIVGSGGGQFGLWLDGDLDRGSTATCSSYSNPPLTGNNIIDFKCAAIEVFSITWES